MSLRVYLAVSIALAHLPLLLVLWGQSSERYGRLLWELEQDRALPLLVIGVTASFVMLGASVVVRALGRNPLATVLATGLALVGPVAMLLTVLLLAPHRSAHIFDVVSGGGLADTASLRIATQSLSEALITIHFAALAAGVLFQASALGIAIAAPSSHPPDRPWATRRGVVLIAAGVLGTAIVWFGPSPDWGYLAALVMATLTATLVGVLLLLRSEHSQEGAGRNAIFVANVLCALLCFGAAVRFRVWHQLFAATWAEALPWEKIGHELTKWSATLDSFDTSGPLLFAGYTLVLVPIALRTTLRASLRAETFVVFGVVGVVTLAQVRLNSDVKQLTRFAERVVPVELSPPKVDARHVSASEGRSSLDEALLVGRDGIVFRSDRSKPLVEIATRSRFLEPDCESLFTTLQLVRISILVDRSTSHRDVICLFAGLESRTRGADKGKPGDYPWGILGGRVRQDPLTLRFAVMLDMGEPPAPFAMLGRQWFDYSARTTRSRATPHLHLTEEAWLLDLEGRSTPIDATSKDRVANLSAAVRDEKRSATLSADPTVAFQDFLDAAVVVSRGKFVIYVP